MNKQIEEMARVIKTASEAFFGMDCNKECADFEAMTLYNYGYRLMGDGVSVTMTQKVWQAEREQLLADKQAEIDGLKQERDEWKRKAEVAEKALAIACTRIKEELICDIYDNNCVLKTMLGTEEECPLVCGYHCDVRLAELLKQQAERELKGGEE